MLKIVQLFKDFRFKNANQIDALGQMSDIAKFFARYELLSRMLKKQTKKLDLVSQTSYGESHQ